MQRKKFLKTSCSICLLASAGSFVSMFSSCAPAMVFKTRIVNNKIFVPISHFEKNNLQIIRARGAEFDIALRKEKDGTYIALLLKCTHAENALTSTGNGFICTVHGSKFDPEGLVTKGPAAHTLKKYQTQIVSENIIISIH
ncbi:MAG: Rieske (2Fe-2S) protein [Bacteroidetes bacterium]|nr:Rieske (2Fe-2S) protein [Bacteroidota bacterium]